jgi:putative endonuclease
MQTPFKNTTQLGAHIETQVAHFLSQKEFRLLQRNFRCNMGEIDLIGRHGLYLVFVEVRYKTQETFSSALESITPAKQRKILLTAQGYIAWNAWAQRLPYRIDVVCVTGEVKALKMDWIQNAFGLG